MDIQLLRTRGCKVSGVFLGAQVASQVELDGSPAKLLQTCKAFADGVTFRTGEELFGPFWGLNTLLVNHS